jgi:hypothetical protein
LSDLVQQNLDQSQIWIIQNQEATLRRIQDLQKKNTPTTNTSNEIQEAEKKLALMQEHYFKNHGHPFEYSTFPVLGQPEEQNNNRKKKNANTNNTKNRVDNARPVEDPADSFLSLYSVKL